MAGTGEILIGILMIGAVIVLTRQFHAWKIKRAYLTIIEDLKSQGALKDRRGQMTERRRQIMTTEGHGETRKI